MIVKYFLNYLLFLSTEVCISKEQIKIAMWQCSLFIFCCLSTNTKLSRAAFWRTVWRGPHVGRRQRGRSHHHLRHQVPTTMWANKIKNNSLTHYNPRGLWSTFSMRKFWCTCLPTHFALFCKQKRPVSLLSGTKNRSNLSCIEHILQNV